MNLEAQMQETQKQLKELKKLYDVEINSFVECPREFLAKKLDLDAFQTKCLYKYPEEFLKGIALNVKQAVDNDWDITIDYDDEDFDQLKGKKKKKKKLKVELYYDFDDMRIGLSFTWQ